MRILITGGAGFIGSNIAEKLLSMGKEVRIFDNLYSGNLDNIEDFKGNTSLEFLEGDLRNVEDVREAVRGVGAVFHEGAITSVPESVKKPQLTEEVNVGGTENLLEVSSSQNVERLVFASTCAVYGEVSDLPIGEDTELRPNSPYAESKLKAEKKCKRYSEKGDLETVILRYFNVYGPRQGGSEYAGVITKFAERLEKGKSPIIYGDGEQSRDFVYVDDVVRANLLALEGEEITGDAFNVGSGKSTSINELCRVISEVFGREGLEPKYREERPGDIRHSESDLSKARNSLDFSPSVSLRKGIKKYMNWRKTH